MEVDQLPCLGGLAPCGCTKTSGTIFGKKPDRSPKPWHLANLPHDQCSWCAQLMLIASYICHNNTVFSFPDDDPCTVIETLE